MLSAPPLFSLKEFFSIAPIIFTNVEQQLLIVCFHAIEGMGIIFNRDRHISAIGNGDNRIMAQIPPMGAGFPVPGYGFPQPGVPPHPGPAWVNAHPAFTYGPRFNSLTAEGLTNNPLLNSQFGDLNAMQFQMFAGSGVWLSAHQPMMPGMGLGEPGMPLPFANGVADNRNQASQRPGFFSRILNGIARSSALEIPTPPISALESEHHPLIHPRNG